MAWYKSWLDTRWRFVIGLAVVLVVACGTVFSYAEIQQVLPELDASGVGTGGRLGEAIQEAFEAQRTFRGYVWFTWFADNLTSLGVLFGALLGSGSPLGSPGRGLLLSLSLPLSRRRWLAARAGTGLVELFVITLAASLPLVAFAPLIGESYGFGDAVVHGASVFAGASVFFGAALLLCTLFNDLWRPLLMTCFGAIALGFAETALPSGYGVFALMSGETYFLTGSLPWIGWLASLALTALLILGAARELVYRDF